jgi:hypothetical protein
MAEPHRDNVAGVATLSPDDCHHPIAKQASTQIANFTIVEPIINGGNRPAREYLLGINGEIEPSLGECPNAFWRIEGDLHRNTM